MTRGESNSSFAASSDFAAGGGKYVAGAEEIEFSFAARSGPAGEDPSGFIFLQEKGHFLLQADVFCLSVSGNLATVAGTITRNEGAFNQPGFEELVFKVNDNRASGAPDKAAHIVTAQGLGQTECYPETVVPSVVHGNIVVHDA
jgi:hypothetical protein